MIKSLSCARTFPVTIIIALIILANLSAGRAQSVELGQQVKDNTWKVTCSSSKQIRQPQSVRVMPVGSGLQIIRQLVPSEGFSLFQVGCTIENSTSMEAHYFLKDMHTYSTPEDAFSVIGMSQGGDSEGPLFLLTLINPELKDTKVTVAPGEKQQVVFLFLAKAKSEALRFQFRDLPPYSLEW
jgi:hypothetical protein